MKKIHKKKEKHFLRAQNNDIKSDLKKNIYHLNAVHHIEEEKINEDLIISKDLNIYLREINFVLPDLTIYLPKSLKFDSPLDFLKKPTFQNLFQILELGGSDPKTIDIILFFREMIKIDQNIGKTELANGLINCGLFIALNGYLNQQIIYILSEKSTAPHKINKNIVVKSIENVNEIIKDIVEILDLNLLNKNSIEQPLNSTMLRYLEMSSDYKFEETALFYFNFTSKKMVSFSGFISEIDFSSFVNRISSKIKQKSEPQLLSCKVLAIKILYNISTSLENINNDSPTQNFIQNIIDPECIAEHFFSIMSINIFQELNYIFRNVKVLNFKAPKQSKHKFLKDFSIEQNVKESIKIWFSSAEALVLIMEFFNEFFFEIENFEEEDSDCEYKRDEMEIEDENSHNKSEIAGEITNTSKKLSEKTSDILLNNGIILLFIDKIRLPEKNILNFLVFYESKIGNIFEIIIKVNNLAVNCLISLFSSEKEREIALDHKEKLVQIISLTIEEILSINCDELENFSSTSHLYEINDALLILLKLLCIIIEKNQEICLKINAISLLNQIEHLQKFEDEVMLMFIDILSIRFCSKFASLYENEELCKVYSKILAKKMNFFLIAHVLNSIFDIFNDENFDENFKKYCFLEVCKKYSLKKNQVFSKDLDLNKSDRQFLEEICINLKNFIDYKEKNLL